jgi:predicted metal-dependent hydrolase
MSGLRKKKWPEKATADVGGHAVEVAVKVHARAKHYRLSIAAGGQPILTVPPYGQWREAAGFLRRQTSWLEARLKHAPDCVRFIDGAVIPVRGDDHLIVMSDKLRGLVQIVEEEERPVLLVPGGREHMARRLTDWLKGQAQKDTEKAVARYARRLGVKPTGLTIRAQT